MDLKNNLKFKRINYDEIHNFYKKSNIEKTFLQDSYYALFRENIGEKVLLFGIYNEKTIIGTALIQKITTKFKTFLHCPHGPIQASKNNQQLINIWIEFLKFYKNLGKDEKCDFVRISPLIDASNNDILNIFKQKKFKNSPIHLVNPEKTWLLDLTQSKEEILKNMKKSTRYEVRRIEKMDISIEIGNTKKDLEIFWDIHQETVKRHKFIPFPKKNTTKELEIYGKNCQIFSAKIDDKFMSSSIILFDDKSAYYHQGASLYSKAPVAHATIWSAICEAKKRGCQYFNFWGVVGDTEKSHPWYGLSRFKKGFGGYEQNFIHCQDFPITNKYWLNFILEKYRKWKRGY